MRLGNSNNSKTNRPAVLALTLLLTCAGGVQVAGAQGLASAGNYSAANALGPDQDSLLPPEVVPLDPSSASSMTATQAANRQAMLAGQSGQMDNFQGMQSAKDARQAAFDSLYGQATLQQSQPVQQQQQQQQWNSGPANQNQMNQNQMIGQNPMNSPALAPYQPSANTMPAQSQTLSGGSKIKPVVRDIRRAGMSNAISAMAGFGAGALVSGALIRPNNPWMGLGMFGMTMTGLGVRNAFRF